MADESSTSQELYELEDVVVDTIGLVKRGANKHSFYLRKSSDKVEGNDDLVKTTVTESKEKTMSENQVDNGFREWVATLLKGLVKEEVGTQVPEATNIVKAQADEKMVSLEKANLQLAERLEKAEKEAAEQRERAERQSLIEKSSGYRSLPVKPAELADMLYHLQKTAPERAQWFEAFVKATNELLMSNSIFAEVGTAQTPEELDVLQKADKLVKEGKATSLKEALLAMPVDEADKYIRGRRATIQ